MTKVKQCVLQLYPRHHRDPRPTGSTFSSFPRNIAESDSVASSFGPAESLRLVLSASLLSVTGQPGKRCRISH